MTATRRGAGLGRIDVHHHALPARYLRDRYDSRIPIEGGAGVGRRRATAADWTPQWSLDEMDRSGTAAAVLSLPGALAGDDGRVDPGLARHSNEYLADLVRDNSDRFAMFAALPLPDVESSLLEVDLALGTLGAAGVGLHSSYGGRWLGDPAFAPLFDELDRRAAVVFVHPTVAPRFRDALPGVGDAFLEYPFDTTRTIVSLLIAGTLARRRRIRFIFAHFGGATASLAERIARIRSRAPSGWAEVAPDGVEAELRRLHYDTASNPSQAALAALLELAGSSQILFGTDAPFIATAGTVDGLAEAGLASHERAAIEAGNALRLLPGLARLLG